MAVPTGFKPKSLLVFSTPDYLPDVISDSIRLADQDVQVVVAGIDTVGAFSSRHGVSELWLDEYMHIERSRQLVDETAEKLRERDGVNIVTVQGRNWKTVASNITVGLSKNHSVSMSLANSLFSTENPVTLFYLQPKHLDQGNAGRILTELVVRLPEGVIADAAPAATDRWTPLLDYDTHEPMIITKCIGNLVKQINKKSAAKILETNDRLMSLASKDTEVYVKLYEKDGPARRYQVIAGGGGWGAKAETIVVSPSARVQKGDRIEFYMLTPSDRFAREDHFDIDNQMVFECSLEETSYDMNQAAAATTAVFGGGSETGVVHNEVEHRSGGERLLFTCK